MTLGRYIGNISSRFDSSELMGQLASVPQWLDEGSVLPLSDGPDQVLKAELVIGGKPVAVAVKVFGRQSLFKDWFDRRNESKAARSYGAGAFLHQQGLGTAEPIAWLDRWDGWRLVESYYLCLHVEAACFRDALVQIYEQERNNAVMMDLLYKVAPALRQLHAAGFMHGDLGNQNILVPKSPAGEWLAPLFIDLNRSRYSSAPLGDRDRAHDLARIALPGGYLEIFKMIYNDHRKLPEAFERLEKKARQRFWGHRRRSRWRHPIRFLKRLSQGQPASPYPSDRDLWLWDEKTAQPVVVLGRAEKRRLRTLSDAFITLCRAIIASPALYRQYRRLLSESYSKPVALNNRFGVALHPQAEYVEQEWALLKALGSPPVLLRFCHHETPEDWQTGIALVERLYREKIPVTVKILQDRQAVLNPDSWRAFLRTVVGAVGDKVRQIEVTHARNRSKWGIWTNQEFKALMQPVLELRQAYPAVNFVGPACIDFEYLAVLSGLADLPKGLHLNGLSQLLYVDRRGAPENKQAGFSTVEKSALLKAIANWSSRVDSRVIVSEVNWPIQGTGLWSPITGTYEKEEWRRDEPGETEIDYANFMLRFLALTVCSGHVEEVYWWRLSARGYGLVDDQNGFEPRPAFKALKFFLHLLGNTVFVKKHETPENCYLLEFSKGAGRILMAWHASGEQPLDDVGPVDAAWDAFGAAIERPIFRASPTYYRIAARDDGRHLSASFGSGGSVGLNP